MKSKLKSIRSHAFHAIPDPAKRQDYLLTLSEHAEKMLAAGRLDELNEWLDDTLSDIIQERQRTMKERQKEVVHRLFTYATPFAAPIIVGLATGTVKIPFL